MINGKIGYELEIGLNRDMFEETEIGEYEDDDGYRRCADCDRLIEDSCSCNPSINFYDLSKEGFLVDSDGSIRTTDRKVFCYELRSKVYNLNEIDTLLKNFKAVTPFFLESNKTMGTHFHISFNKDDTQYLKLCSWDFVSKFQKAYLKKFTYQREQERQKNKFCVFYTSKEDFKKRIKNQLNRQSQRYNSINFLSFFKYRTIEFRLFPSTKYYKRFKRYLFFLLGFIQEYLKKNDIKLKREKRLTKKEINPIIEITETIDKEINIVLDSPSKAGGFICAE